MSAAEQRESFEQVLDAVRRSAADLLTDTPHRPSALRVRAGDVAVEMEWHPLTAGEMPIADGAPTVDRLAVHGAGSLASEARPAAGSDAAVLRAPTVGVFYVAPEPGAKPFVTVGDRVGVGQQVALIEAMKLMVPVEADCSGVVVEVLQPDAAPVEYGDPLFAIDPAA